MAKRSRARAVSRSTTGRHNGDDHGNAGTIGFSLDRIVIKIFLHIIFQDLQILYESPGLPVCVEGHERAQGERHRQNKNLSATKVRSALSGLQLHSGGTVSYEFDLLNR